MTNSNLVGSTKKQPLKVKKTTFKNKNKKECVKEVYKMRNRFISYHKPYKLPNIIRCANGIWYVEYKYEHPDKPGTYKSFKVKDGINRIKEPELKELAAQQLKKDIINALEKLNYNPFEIKTNIKANLKAQNEIKKSKQNWTIKQGANEYLEFIKSNGYSERSVRSYRINVMNFLKWCESNNFADTYLCDFTEMDLQICLDYNFKTNNWSSRTYNNFLKFMVTFFNKVRLLEKTATKNRNLKYEFNSEDLTLKVTKAQKNKAITPAILKLIKTELDLKSNEDLRDYVEFIFLSLMRPKEIRDLKFSDIDLISRQIRIIGKTGDRIIPISNQLYKLIEKRGANNIPHNYFIFGYAGTVSAKNVSQEHFFKKFGAIIKKLNLDKNYSPYSFKSTGVIAMINAGFTDREIMVLSGHKTQAAFEVYKRDLIINNGNIMKGELVDF